MRHSLSTGDGRGDSRGGGGGGRASPGSSSGWAEAARGALHLAAHALPNPRSSGAGTNPRSAATMVDQKQVAKLFERLEQGGTLALSGGTLLPPGDLVPLKNASGETLLITAARVGAVDAVRQLLIEQSAACDPDDTDFDGWSALLTAAHGGHDECARLLLEAGAAVDQPDLIGWTALMWSAYKGHVACVRLFLQNRAHVNLVDEEDGLTPLIVAAARGYTDIVRALLDADAQVNACDKFGSTALIWAARRGHATIVEQLLNRGAELDAVGMYSSTALIMATRGNFTRVVELLLQREPNVQHVDQNCLSALGIAAREGYVEIAESLAASGAYVNIADRFGNWILASAVRSGSLPIVRLLLDKYADVNARDSENRTALHIAIDKGYMDIVLALLERKPNLELKNKDGETALLRAVKSRHVALCQLLVNAGAKVSAVDNAGDNALHLALRARSRRLTQLLLASPGDSRLLYRPNRRGQTPYSIDQANPQPVLPLIFGPVDADLHSDAMLCYDVYSNVLADMLCEPALALPLTVGLYAKWGSGKSILLAKLKESMRIFSRSWLDAVRLRFSFSLLAFIFFLVAFVALFFAVLVSISANVLVVAIVGVLSILVFVLLSSGYGIVYWGSEVGNWAGAGSAALLLARILAHLRLIVAILHSEPPTLSASTGAGQLGAATIPDGQGRGTAGGEGKERQRSELGSNPVSFLFADYHRLSSIGGEQALAKIVVTLFESAEQHFGTLAVRFFCALHSASAAAYGYRASGSGVGRVRRVCGLPFAVLAACALLALVGGEILLMLWLHTDRTIVESDGKEQMPTASSGLLWTAIGLFVVFFLVAVYPVTLLLRYGLCNVPKGRINRAARQVHQLRFEGFMQRLQSEVDLLADMVHCLDALTRSQTRLVVVVDGLDNCEQERMVQTLDSLDLLFSARKGRPFIVVIAVDPHIIISALQHSMHSALSGTELTGHDYLKNIVNMPFYLHSTALRQLQHRLKERRDSVAGWKERIRRQETVHGSHLSLRGVGLDDAQGGAGQGQGGGGGGGGATSTGRPRKSTWALANQPTLAAGVAARGVGDSLLADDYFSSMNPRAMRRIVNALTLTGRLMRTFDVDFSWLALGNWVALIEQWPVRMCWLLERAGDAIIPSALTLGELYRQLRHKIPKKGPDALLDLDRNPENFEAFLESTAGPGAPDPLTVGHARRFIPCTTNLDPYLRKLIRERREKVEEPELLAIESGAVDGATADAVAALIPAARRLFTDETVWSRLEIPLVEMRIDDIVKLVQRLDISPDRLDRLLSRIRAANLNGLVLSTCPMEELRRELMLTLGDWTLIKLLVETLRAFGAAPPGLVQRRIAGNLAQAARRSAATAAFIEEEDEAHHQHAHHHDHEQEKLQLVETAIVNELEETAEGTEAEKVALLSATAALLSPPPLVLNGASTPAGGTSPEPLLLSANLPSPNGGGSSSPTLPAGASAAAIATAAAVAAASRSTFGSLARLDGQAVDSTHAWLMTSLQVMDSNADEADERELMLAAEASHVHSLAPSVAGDDLDDEALNRPSTPSVELVDDRTRSRAGTSQSEAQADEEEARSADSTESRFGSRENLLDEPPQPTSKRNSVGNRSDIMRRMRQHSFVASSEAGHSSQHDDAEYQQTVRERAVTEGASRQTAADLFQQQLQQQQQQQEPSQKPPSTPPPT